MSTKNDPAFPTEFSTAEFCAGLTKLEWFAGMALAAYADSDMWSRYAELAEHCFKCAEAMLAESERRK